MTLYRKGEDRPEDGLGITADVLRFVAESAEGKSCQPSESYTGEALIGLYYIVTMAEKALRAMQEDSAEEIEGRRLKMTKGEDG